jgi:hypothetical protein
MRVTLFFFFFGDNAGQLTIPCLNSHLPFLVIGILVVDIVPVDWKDSLKQEVVRVMNTIALRMAVRSIV